MPSKILSFSATCGGKAAARGPQAEDLGGAPKGYPALQTSPENADHVSRAVLRNKKCPMPER